MGGRERERERADENERKRDVRREMERKDGRPTAGRDRWGGARERLCPDLVCSLRLSVPGMSLKTSQELASTRAPGATWQWGPFDHRPPLPAGSHTACQRCQGAFCTSSGPAVALVRMPTPAGTAAWQGMEWYSVA